VVLDKDGNKTAVLKPAEEWSTAKDELALGLRMLGKFSKLLMKVHLRQKVQDFNFLLQNLRI